MSLDEIRKRTSNGFRPFVIKTSDGKEYPVPHREFIMITKRSVVVADADGFIDILDPLHIVALNVEGELPAS
ncbi:MAG TPA: hypothetical protein VEO95_06880 [Chthoniobacteraceae bacterium]|nr:hypothetical protein [Chthoniobacteraceae bacterium]